MTERIECSKEQRGRKEKKVEEDGEPYKEETGSSVEEAASTKERESISNSSPREPGEVPPPHPLGRKQSDITNPGRIDPIIFKPLSVSGYHYIFWQ